MIHRQAAKGGSAQLGLGYSCGKFDPVAAVTHKLNDIGAGVDNMMNAMCAAASAAGPVPLAASTRLSEIWSNRTDARDWIVDVVGENIVTTCKTCRKDSIPVTGLLPKLHQESTAVTTDLQNLVNGTTPPTLANLEDVTAPGIAITR